MKAVPGRKTEVKDAEWIADLLRHGLLKASFVPPPRTTRTQRTGALHRRGLIGQRAQVTQRLQKVLEGANVKLANAVSDITGKTGLAILRAMVAGEERPQSAFCSGARQLAGPSRPARAPRWSAAWVSISALCWQACLDRWIF